MAERIADTDKVGEVQSRGNAPDWGSPAAGAGEDLADAVQTTLAVHGGGIAKSANTATELIGDSIAIVDVSKHPVASIPESELSLADIERSRSRPLQRTIYIVVILVALIGPYWLGRSFAANRTEWLVSHLNLLNAQGVAFVSWAVTFVTLAALGLMVVDVHKWLWRAFFAISLAAEQFIAGLCLLRFNFWYSTYVVYGKSAGLANAANLGIIGAVFAVAAFAVLWVGLLVLIRKDSPLNVLTHSWASFIMFFVIEAIALAIVLGALLTMI
ncbi:hypothetical protein [Bifidobacterium sp.]|jgi:hypothetical protein|uniref:hypothetical protein n=1 Tax=Bifidobacterium sp. TaxID=41200 RepID=UPI0025BB1C04|nr:hypothetical protein [Bifidobacterium sp.]MCH4209819.1 hypothetical protein [Bifidobacterium sp.]MCI1224548.1 hypothetical protein [Bifidobacterium sp.]